MWKKIKREEANRKDVSLSRRFTNGYEEEIEEVTDWYYRLTLEREYNGHGTAVAGIIGAVGNNGVGITGTCWNVRLASLQVFDSDGYGRSSWVIEAIDFAESKDIPIINFSEEWYGDYLSYYDEPINTAIENYSGLFVAIAGNAGVNIDTNICYPANCTASNMIVVGGCTSYDDPWVGSNYGRGNVDIYAPGEGVYSTNSIGGYESWSGTSFAAPYVSGVAALLLSENPTLTVSELKTAILTNGDIVYDSEGDNMYFDYCSSGKRLNAYRAVSDIAQ